LQHPIRNIYCTEVYKLIVREDLDIRSAEETTEELLPNAKMSRPDTAVSMAGGGGAAKAAQVFR